MRTTTRLLALALLLLAVAGCDVGDGLTDIGPSVSGQVVDAATGGPVPEATITVGGRIGSSHANGAYFIADVPRGNHLLRVTKSGYIDYVQEVNVENGIFNKTIPLAK